MDSQEFTVAQLTVRGPSPTRHTHSLASESFSSLRTGRQSDGADSVSGYTLAHPDHSNVIVDGVGVVVLVGGGVAGGHNLPVWLCLVVNVLGTKMHFEGADTAHKIYLASL